MIWKVRAVEAWPGEDETEYEFNAPIMGSDGHEIQILDFTPEMDFPVEDETGIHMEERPAVVLYAYPDRSEP